MVHFTQNRAWYFCTPNYMVNYKSILELLLQGDLELADPLTAFFAVNASRGTSAD